MQTTRMVRVIGWTLLVALGMTLALAMSQPSDGAQNESPMILVTWTGENAGQEQLRYSILDAEGNTLVEDRMGLSGAVEDVDFRICGTHWTGQKWIVIVDDGERLSERGLIKVVVNPDGSSGWFGISSTFNYVGDVMTQQTDGSGQTGGCTGR